MFRRVLIKKNVFDAIEKKTQINFDKINTEKIDRISIHWRTKSSICFSASLSYKDHMNNETIKYFNSNTFEDLCSQVNYYIDLKNK